MKEEIEKISYEIWNEEARKQLENELNFMVKEKIELPKGKDYLKMYVETHKTPEQQLEELQERINKAIEYVKNNWYSKNTRNIDELHSLGDWRLDLLNILQGKDENK